MNAAQRPPFPSPESSQSPSSGPFLEQTSGPRRAYRPKRAPHAGTRRAIAFESSVKLTVNLLLTVVATTTIAKLVPYYRSQQQRFTTLQASVQAAEQKNAELRSQFSHHFDPTQASHIMQAQSGRAYPNQKKVIWTAPLDPSPLAPTQPD